MPAPTTISSNRSRSASCSRASARSSSATGCTQKVGGAARNGRSPERRVPRDAGARAAQSARADPQRRRECCHAPCPPTRARKLRSGIVRRQVTHLHATRGRPARRLAHHPGSHRAATPARSALSEIITQALETVEPLLRDKRHKVSRDPELRNAARERRPRPPRSVRSERAHERRQVHRRQRRHRASSGTGMATRQSSRFPTTGPVSPKTCCRTFSSCSCRAPHARSLRRAASESASQ